MSAKEDPRIKNLRIKTSVLKRLIKEKAHYEKEVTQIKEKINKMKEEKTDEYLIKKQIELQTESQSMIPDCQRRVQAAYEELKILMSEDWKGFTDNEQYKAADEVLDGNKELDQQ